jgi:ribose-phosphate pyrophosphokinase
MIIPGSASQGLAGELAAELGEPLARAEYDSFADGEILASVPDFEGDRAIVVASTDSNEAHVELLQLQDAARVAGASEVITVIPYMGYARQDRPFKYGQPISARAVAKAISTGSDRVLVANPHEENVCDFFDVPATPVDASPRLAAPLPPDLDDPLFLSPDEGAIELAETVRDAYGRGTTDYFEKNRDYDTGDIEITPSAAQVDSRDVVLVDDIIATGSTMSASIEELHDRDVDKVYVTCVHPMLASNARTKLAAAGVEAVFGTDTLERSVSTVSAAPIVAKALEPLLAELT